MLHLLLSEPHDVFLDEQEVGLVGLDGVPQIVLLDWLFRVSQVRRQNPDAGRRLQVLGVIDLVEKLLDRSDHHLGSDVKHFQDPRKNLLEALKVPVLVDDGVNDGIVKDLMSLLRQQEHQVVHRVDSVSILQVVLAPLWEELLSDQSDQIFQVSILSQFPILSGIHN